MLSKQTSKLVDVSAVVVVGTASKQNREWKEKNCIRRKTLENRLSAVFSHTPPHLGPSLPLYLVRVNAIFAFCFHSKRNSRAPRIFYRCNSSSSSSPSLVQWGAQNDKRLDPLIRCAVCGCVWAQCRAAAFRGKQNALHTANSRVAVIGVIKRKMLDLLWRAAANIFYSTSEDGWCENCIALTAIFIWQLNTLLVCNEIIIIK